MKEIKEEIDKLIVDDPDINLSAPSKSARKKLLGFSLLSILYIIFQPETPLTYLSQYFHINNNKELLPVVWLLLNTWLLLRYYMHLRKEGFIVYATPNFFAWRFPLSPLMQFNRRKKQITPYFDRTGLKIILIITYFENAVFHLVKILLIIVSGILFVPFEKGSEESRKLQETLDDHYRYGGAPIEIIEQIEIDLNSSLKRDEAQYNANSGLFNMDIKLPLYVGIISIVLIADKSPIIS